MNIQIRMVDSVGKEARVWCQSVPIHMILENGGVQQAVSKLGAYTSFLEGSNQSCFGLILDTVNS